MLADALATTRTALGEARRAIGALRASPLDDFGLAKALRQLAESAAAHAGLTLVVQAPNSIECLSRETEHAVYRIATEAITNVVRHADARTLTVKLAETAETVRLLVADDGRGFDSACGFDEGRFGLYGMQERARLIAAEIAVDSAPGAGTTVRLTVRRADDTRPDL
jgi:two-component system sensor histidine kinase UhpB